MGEEVRGSTVLRGALGHRDASAAASRTADGAYFAPLITNAAAQPLRVTVNAGLQGAVDCGCAVRPGGAPGVHRLLPALPEQHACRAVRPGARRRPTFRDLGPQVTRADGTVGLRFEDKDLRGR